MASVMEDIIRIKHLELVHLDLSYSHIRVQNAQAVMRMVDSMQRYGQIMPILVVAADYPRHTLIDGYLRVAAARRLGHDTLLSHIWHGDEKHALCHILVKDDQRRWDIFEQAGLIKELLSRHQLSQRELSRLLGKDPSWVSRRLTLLETLPEQVLNCVQRGTISSWAATRVLTPMARANADHARRLADSLIKQRFSTRQLFIFFKHYQRSNRKVRENMVNEPLLFIKTIQSQKDNRDSQQLAQGPEGQWIRQLRTIYHMIQRLISTTDTVIYAGQSNLDRRSLLTVFSDADQMWCQLKKHIERRIDDICERARDDFSTARGRKRHPADQPAVEHLQKYSAPRDQGTTSIPNTSDNAL
jgi:ParB family chromosome partitioning protein